MLSNALVIESSTTEGSVAFVRDGAVVSSAFFFARDAITGVRTEGLGPAVAAALAEADVAPGSVESIVCDAGPGGFTSLRCAGAFAKGMCSALSIPLYAVSSLELLAWSAEMHEGAYVAALSAGRDEWFASVVYCDARGDRTVSPPALLTRAELTSAAERHDAALVGPGLEIDVNPQARAVLHCMATLARTGPVSLDDWEPTYGRLAEAQVKWEAAHGRPLSASA